jgi:hypothetical protein
VGDIRATERILAQLAELDAGIVACLGRIKQGDVGALGDALEHAAKLAPSIAELQRGGDTLVRRDDLRRALE